MSISEKQIALEPCPFPHDVKLGVFLEIDTEDFGFVRAACSDCGCAGPYVTLDNLEGATEDEKHHAATLWNTRAMRQLEPDGDEVERVAREICNGLRARPVANKWIVAAPAMIEQLLTRAALVRSPIGDDVREARRALHSDLLDAEEDCEPTVRVRCDLLRTAIGSQSIKGERVNG